jgi:archaellum component FlaC
MKDILIIVIPSLLSAFTGWVLGYRKQNIDLCSDRLDELEKSINVYNKIINDMSIKIDGLRKEITRLETQIQDLIKENKQLKNKNSI